MRVQQAPSSGLEKMVDGMKSMTRLLARKSGIPSENCFPIDTDQVLNQKSHDVIKWSKSRNPITKNDEKLKIRAVQREF